MHRLPKMFTKSDRRRTTISSAPSAGAGKPKRRLERVNGNRNFNYEFSPPSTSASSSSYFSSDECLRARSLELYDGKTSFRIDGDDGEIDIICKSLGLNGMEDLSIPEAEYTAMKLRSSSAPVLLSGARSRAWSEKGIELNYDDEESVGVVNRTSDVISTSCEEIRAPSDVYSSFYCRLGDNSGVNRMSYATRMNCEEVGVSSGRFGGNVRGNDVITSEFRGNGIKGVRPPVLVPPLPVDVKDGSTCDIFRAFTPDGNRSGLRFEGVLRLNEEGDEDGKEVGRKGSVMRRAETSVLSESYSFTTSSDSSSTTTPMSSNSPIRRFRRVIVDWQKGELLGRGSFGSVYEGIADDGFFFAVKEVSLLDQEDDGKQRILQLEQEIALLSQFEHENIVRYYGTKKDESHLYIFLELVTKGSLLSLYRKYNLKDQQVSAYTRQILHGLKYLHDKNVVHRDIKCANILVDTSGLVKLADFGLAKATKLNDVKSCKGTPFWMAPEVVRSKGSGLPADIWSLGCTVLEMLTRSFPYSDMEWMSALYKIGRGERPPIPDSLSSDARDFILNCLQVDPSSRPKAAQLLDHPFVRRPLPQTSGSASPHYLSRQS